MKLNVLQVVVKLAGRSSAPIVEPRSVGRVGILGYWVGDVGAVSEESVADRVGRTSDPDDESVEAEGQ